MESKLEDSSGHLMATTNDKLCLGFGADRTARQPHGQGGDEKTEERTSAETEGKLKRSPGSCGHGNDDETEVDGDELSRRSGFGSKRRMFYVVVTVLCSFLICATLGFIYTFSNINPYLTSYLRNVTGDATLNYADTMWIYQSIIFTACVAMPLVGLVANRMPLKIFMGIGVLFTVASTLGNYYAMPVSLPLVIFAFGVLGGIPGAFLYPTCIRISAEWLPQRRGLVTGIILTGYGVGSFVWTTLSTWYINSGNLQPDLQDGEDLYFTQPEILDKVRDCLLLLGVIFTGVQTVCTVLIRVPPRPRILSIEVVTHDDEKTKLIQSRSQEDDGDEDNEKKEIMTTRRNQLYGSIARTPPEDVQYGPARTLKTRVFWTLWAMLFFSQFSMACIPPLIKAYGQTFIYNDHFLAITMSASSICNAAGRPFWGLLADRFGSRTVALLAQGFLACVVVTLMACEDTGEVMFLIWVCGLYLGMCGFITMLPTLTLVVFGPNNFNVNVGLLDSSAAFGAVLSVVFVPILMDQFGWHGIFFCGFGGSFIGVLLNMSLSIRCGNSIPRHMWPALSLP